MSPLQERARTDNGPLNRLRRILPIGAGLTPGIWRGRHRAICALGWAHAVGVPLYGLSQGRQPSHALLEGFPIALFALVASLPFLPRRARGVAASMALLSSSAVLVHFSNGLIEMHFHFFVMVPIVALYQDWATFGLAIAYVFAHHGLVGMLDPEAVFNHPFGQRNPWKWAAVHAMFIAGISLVCLATWRMTETLFMRQRTAEDDLLEEKRVVETLHSIGTGVVSELDIDRVTQLVTDEAVKAIGAEFGAFFYNVYDSDGGSYMLYALSGVPRSAFENFAMPRNTQVFSPTFAGTEEVVRSDDITDDERYGHNAPYEGMPAGHLPVRSYLAVPVRSRGSSEVLGGLFFGHPQPARFTEREERIAVGIATQAAVAFDNARLYQAERDAHQAAEHARSRLTLLAEAGSLLVASLDPETTLRSMASITVPTLADICVVDLFQDGAIERVEAFASQGMEHLAENLKQFPPDTDNDDHPVVRVIRGGASELVSQVTPELLDKGTRNGEHRNLVTTMQGTSSLIVPLIGRGAVLGAVSFLTVAASGRTMSSDDLPLAEEIARRAGMAVENARLYQAEREARVEANRASTNLALLAEAGRLSATPLDEDVRVQQLAQLTVPTLADACLIDVLEEDGTIRRVTAAAKGHEGFATRLGDFPPDPSDTFHPVVKVIGGHAPILVEEIGDDFLDEVTRGSDHRHAALPAEVGSTVIVPLAARGGIYGSLCLINIASSGRRFTASDVPLVEEIGRRAGVAVHNARLFKTERAALETAEEASARLSLLSDASRVLASSLDVDTTLSSVARLAVPMLADLCVIDVIGSEGELRRVASSGAPGLEELTEEVHGLAPPDKADYANPVIRVAEGKGTQLLDRVERRLTKDPAEDDEYLALARRSRTISTLSVPLVGRHEVLGVLSLITTAISGRILDTDDVSLAEELGRRAGIAIENARLYNEQRSVAESLQHALLPQELPSIAGFEATARYLPGSPGEHVGGDWYDLFEVPSGEIAVVMGDVVGHGIPAASSMAQLRNALRAYVWDGVTPAEVLSRLNQLLYGLEREGLATVSLGLLDPITSTLRLASAGHPPILHARGQNGLTFAGEGLGPPLGAIPFAHFREHEIKLQTNDMLIFYTDGLVEDRRTSLDVGMECLRMAIKDEFANVDGLADHVLDVCLGDRTIDDDTALLILRATAIGDRLSVRLPTEPRVLGQFRQTLRRWLRENSVPEAEALDILVACGEACNNAIEHGSAARNGSFEVEAHVDGDLDIVVRNEGTWRTPRDDGGGRGLPVMEGLMDDVKIDRSSGTIEVRMHKTIRPKVTA